MKKLLALFYALIFFSSCNVNQSGEEVVDEEEMVNVLIDMHLVDAVMNYRSNQDSLQMEANSRYNYIFKKHNIDSTTFSNSLKYYTSKNEVMLEIYDQVLDSLTAMEKPNTIQPYVRRWNIAETDTSKLDSLQLIRFQNQLKTPVMKAADSMLFRNSRTYNPENYEVAYGLYSYKVDSLRDMSRLGSSKKTRKRLNKLRKVN